MKAILHTQYGPPEVLHFTDVSVPTPKDDEVLIKLYAASVNPLDLFSMRGAPMIRLIPGLRTPKHQILGCDIAGRVETVGKNVKQFHPGDEVFGDLSGRWGGMAEYVCARENALALKPTSMSFEEAAAIPQAAMLAIQGLRDKGQIQNCPAAH